jgi:hypothetical protein
MDSTELELELKWTGLDWPGRGRTGLQEAGHNQSCWPRPGRTSQDWTGSHCPGCVQLDYCELC